MEITIKEENPILFLSSSETDGRRSLSSSSSYSNHHEESSFELSSRKKQKVSHMPDYVSRVKEEPLNLLDATESVGLGFDSLDWGIVEKSNQFVASPLHDYNYDAGVPVTAITLPTNPVSAIKEEPSSIVAEESMAIVPHTHVVNRCSKQFWKAGDFKRSSDITSASQVDGVDRLRVHPRFLHSNATSHKWTLGAFAELLDNALDEVHNGATYVSIDTMKSEDGIAMVVVEDNGGGMTPGKIRQCMSLGYSEKSNMANTIGQYGNGFKTSTMRIGADVIVLSRCRGRDGRCASQSIGMLSYNFLVNTGKDEIIVPMIDYEYNGEGWSMMVRSNAEDWMQNLETILQWTPYKSENDLLKQLNDLNDQGTRVVIYNLWEDDQGQLELDFTSDEHDIQVRGVDRNVKNIAMAKDYPNSKHFLTYRHSLRSYASILYKKIPNGFRMILRGKEIEHHSIVNDMMHAEFKTYVPKATTETQMDQNVCAFVNIGFVKDAVFHIDIQGFNVYHKNRLIKPFWRVYHAAGSGGRGVIGVVEADFVEPTHDKQDFEHTTVYTRLEARLKEMQKSYWGKNAYLIGYTSGQKKAQPASNLNNNQSTSHNYGHAPSHIEPNISSNGTVDPRSSCNYTVQQNMRGIHDNGAASNLFSNVTVDPRSSSSYTAQQNMGGIHDNGVTSNLFSNGTVDPRSSSSYTVQQNMGGIHDNGVASNLFSNGTVDPRSSRNYSVQQNMGGIHDNGVAGNLCSNGTVDPRSSGNYTVQQNMGGFHDNGAAGNISSNGTVDPRSSCNYTAQQNMGGIHDNGVASNLRGMQQPDYPSNWGSVQNPEPLSAVKIEMDSGEAQPDVMNPFMDTLMKLQEENIELKQVIDVVMHDLEGERDKIQVLQQEKEMEKIKRDKELEALRAKLQKAFAVIHMLSEKVKQKRLEKQRRDGTTG